VPILGALYNRRKWGKFRNQFDDFRLKPVLDYSAYRKLNAEGGLYRFSGGFESITEGKTLWIQGDNLTIPVSLENIKTWVLPIDAGTPELIRWDHISTLTEGTRVFVGGQICLHDNKWSFVSTKENPLMVIFHDCPDKSLTTTIIRSGRNKNEYWNSFTPVSILIGAISQIYIAVIFLDRPAFRLTVIWALIALFIPALPWLPPGLLFLALYRRIALQARKLRAYSDLVKLPLRHLFDVRHYQNEKYGFLKSKVLPKEAEEGSIPVIIPEFSGKKRGREFYTFGVISHEGILSEPKDPFAFYGVLPGEPRQLSRRYIINSYILETVAWLILIIGIAVNLFFINMIIFMLGGVSF
jgi:hypothetical protein